MSFPVHRLRRLRRTEGLRGLVRETRITPDAMVYPLFVGPGKGVRKEISSMPGQFNLSVDRAVEVAREAEKLGVGGLLLFGLPLHKDETGSDASDDSVSSL